MGETGKINRAVRSTRHTLSSARQQNTLRFLLVEKFQRRLSSQTIKIFASKDSEVEESSSTSCRIRRTKQEVRPISASLKPRLKGVWAYKKERGSWRALCILIVRRRRFHGSTVFTMQHALFCLLALAPALALAQPLNEDVELEEPDKKNWNSLQGMWGKRGWNDLQGMWGKRGWNDLQGMWGKRGWNDMQNMWGKRGWNDLQGMWGKRGWNDLQGMWGKRGWNDLQGVWGKRNPNWNNLKGMWGKRSDTESISSAAG